MVNVHNTGPPCTSDSQAISAFLKLFSSSSKEENTRKCHVGNECNEFYKFHKIFSKIIDEFYQNI